MADKVPSIRLNSGYDMPMLGIGTFNSFRQNEVGDAVKAAIEIGYRHIDTAWLYQTEPEIGVAIKELIKESKVKREELFIVTKMWVHCHEPDQVEPACRMSLEALDMDYIDLYLIHFPIAFADEEMTKPTMTDYLDTWRAMEKLVDKGLVRSIGVSNFNKQQLERILKMEGLKYKPANNQVEISPYLAQEELLQFCLKNGISTTAFASFGAPGQSYITKDAPKTLEDPTIVDIGRKYNKSTAQVILRWGMQRGFALVPKSTNPARLAQNMDVFDFKLNEEDMKAMLALDRGYRINVHKYNTWKDHPFYPFEK
ncbi:aldo-keto reductase family 1 member B1-like isoform X2 [Haliotis rubra]|uniref:aldo-keto reductase family 1 member B1-like isoform X2 n=1 Tax=Haliotis rubra TaxID=36100 RepID=UPI001EE5DD5F|nr:aldo-keto reductase family 1 member B1-like isoform X2 [Haliotis rubra]XP_046546023.1 aldo-keto reductase family 1 member B1-like isoform X2 [Haliotis rubra]XP_046546024.1 aldo-keto reductase family 1 member B1-like isoform X2 [Haliotis rubra]XP_046546025.1 aldo-keto reductase family 1 member B1-like isoform X2 [Haliotis rubra]